MATTANTRTWIRLAYGVYAWAVLIFCVVPVTAACLLVPGLDRRRRIARRGAEVVFGMIGSPVAVHGSFPDLTPRPVVVANHASYLDGIILTAVLPPEYTFLIKWEMNSVPIAGYVLRRLGSEFVDRSNSTERHRSARRLVEATLHGHAIAVFPEGTFDTKPGLKPFHIGAFRAAFRAGVAIVPIVIEGSRQKLVADTWLPVPGPLSVTICAAIPPGRARNANELVRLTRKRMLAVLDEPDLGDIVAAGGGDAGP